MNTLASMPLFTTTMGSVAPDAYLALHTASSDMSIFGLAGTAPVNLIDPLTEPPCAFAGAAPSPKPYASARNAPPVLSNTRLMIPPKKFISGPSARVVEHAIPP